MSTKTIYGFDDLGNKVPIGEYDNSVRISLTENCPYLDARDLIGAGTYDLGDSVTIEAPVGSGAWVFNGWYDGLGNLISQNNIYTFIATENIVYNAIYGGGGSIN